MPPEAPRVLLNGEGGDEWLGGKPFHYTEQLREFDFAGAAKSFAEDRAAFSLRHAVRRLVRFGIAPMTRAPLLAMRRKFRRTKGPNAFLNAYWLSPRLDQLLTRLRIEASQKDYLAIKNMARRAMFLALQESYCEMSRDHFDRQCARQGYEPRTPMYARRFIEFSFATPEHIRLRGGIRKHVHIKALADLLPEIVLHRKTKADFSLAFEHHLDKMKCVLTDKLVASETGHPDRQGVARLYEFCRVCPLDDKPVWELWGIFACESIFQAYRMVAEN